MEDLEAKKYFSGPRTVEDFKSICEKIVDEYMRGEMARKIHTMEDFDSRRRAGNSPRFCYDAVMKKDMARIRRRVADLDSPED